MNGEYRITEWHYYDSILYYVMHSLGSGTWTVLGTFGDRQSAGVFIRHQKEDTN